MKLNGKLLDKLKYQLICCQYPDRFQLHKTQKEFYEQVDDFWSKVLGFKDPNFIPGMALTFSSSDGSEENK